MYLDESIKPSDNLPKSIKRNMRQLDEYYFNDDWFAWEQLMDIFDVEVRALASEGKVSESDCNKILKRYGWR